MAYRDTESHIVFLLAGGQSLQHPHDKLRLNNCDQRTDQIIYYTETFAVSKFLVRLVRLIYSNRATG